MVSKITSMPWLTAYSEPKSWSPWKSRRELGAALFGIRESQHLPGHSRTHFLMHEHRLLGVGQSLQASISTSCPIPGCMGCITNYHLISSTGHGFLQNFQANESCSSNLHASQLTARHENAQEQRLHQIHHMQERKTLQVA